MKDDNEKNPLELEEDGGKEEKESSTGIALGLCFGAALGLAAQMLTGDIIWLPMGVAVGFGLGTAVGTTGKKKK